MGFWTSSEFGHLVASLVPTRTLSMAGSQFSPLQNEEGCSLYPFSLGVNSAKKGLKNVTELNPDRGLVFSFAYKHLLSNPSPPRYPHPWQFASHYPGASLVIPP